MFKTVVIFCLQATDIKGLFLSLLSEHFPDFQGINAKFVNHSLRITSLLPPVQNAFYLPFQPFALAALQIFGTPLDRNFTLY